MTDDGLAAHMSDIERRLSRWLAKQSPEDRIEHLADLRQSLVSIADMERSTRLDTLIELVDRNGLEAIAQSLKVTPDRLIRAIAPDG